MKPREFWISDDLEYVSVNTKYCEPEYGPWMHVREVLPIDWERVWVAFAEQNYTYIISKSDQITIKALVERALKGTL